MRATLWFFQKGYLIYDILFSQKYEKVSTHISAAKLPWLFVGIELLDGTIIDKTECVQHLVDRRMSINYTSICSSVDLTMIKRCFYLDTETLKEEEIPTEGLTIE
jgi:hypothetical protein